MAAILRTNKDRQMFTAQDKALITELGLGRNGKDQQSQLLQRFYNRRTGGLY